jgi:hypothetical protein
MLPEDLPFKVVRINPHDEVLLRVGNLHIGRAAYETAIRLFPKDTIPLSERSADHREE